MCEVSVALRCSAMGTSMIELPALHGVGALASTLSHRGALGDPSAICRGPEVLLGLSFGFLNPRHGTRESASSRAAQQAALGAATSASWA